MNGRHMKAYTESPTGRLSRVFVGLAFANFLVGASLGGWMAVQPLSWARIGMIHAEINPFGWLTMLIYGMTYAVLAISAGLRPPKAWVGWIHVACAELAIALTVCGVLYGWRLGLVLGLTLQCVAPVIFLANILLSVAARERLRSMSERVDKGEQYTSLTPVLASLSRSPQFQGTDRIGQRGTDISLMLFLVGTGWMIGSVIRSPSTTMPTTPASEFLVYYGWIGGAIFAVSLHLFPRFMKVRLGGRLANSLQHIWVAAIVCGVAGEFFDEVISHIASRILGAVIVIYGAMYLLASLVCKPTMTGVYPPRASRIAWIAAWTFCVTLGVALICGVNPFSLLALHLLFLGFATNLVYGIGYMLFPHLLRRQPPGHVISLAQISCSILGSLLMVVAFGGLQFGFPGHTFPLLAAGGSLAWGGALGFILIWVFALVRSQKA